MNRYDTIEKLQMDLDIPDIVQQKADEAFAQIYKTQTENQSDVIPRRTSASFPKRRIAVIIAAAILALATITAAAAYFNWSSSLSEGLQITEEQKVQMEENNMTTFVNQSCVDQGITVTAIQSITDNYYTHIAFRVEGFTLEEGIQPAYENFFVTVDGEIDFGYAAQFYDRLIMGTDGRAANADGTPLETEENGDLIMHYTLDDGSLEFHLLLYNTHEKGYFFNKPIHVEMNNLGFYEKADYVNVLDGTWSFDWTLQGSDVMREYTPGISLGDSGAVVSRVEISPISLLVEYDFPRQEISETYLDENEEEVTMSSYAEPPQLTGVKLKDGTLYPYLYLGPGTTDYDSEQSDTYITAFAIDRVIDVDQVESLLFIKFYPENEEPLTEENFYIVPVNQ